MDPGESVMETAFRETIEESGLRKEDLKIYDDVSRELNYEVRGKPKKVTYWLAELINYKAEVKLSTEHQDFKWIRLQDASQYGLHKEIADLLQFCDNHINSKIY